MSFNKDKTQRLLSTIFTKHDINALEHPNNAGVTTIEIMHHNHFYVLHLEYNSASILKADKKITNFDSIPDERFYNTEKFVNRIESLLYF